MEARRSSHSVDGGMEGALRNGGVRVLLGTCARAQLQKCLGQLAKSVSSDVFLPIRSEVLVLGVFRSLQGRNLFFKVISSCNASLYSIQTHCFAPQAVCTHHLYNAARGALEALLWWRLRAKLSHKITLLLVSNYWYFPVSVVTVEQLEQEDPERREKSSLATHAMVAILGMYIHLCACDTCGGVSYIRVGGLVWETVCVHEDVFDTRFLTCAVSSARKRSLPPTSSHSTASFDHRAERAGEGIAQLKGNS